MALEIKNLISVSAKSTSFDDLLYKDIMKYIVTLLLQEAFLLFYPIVLFPFYSALLLCYLFPLIFFKLFLIFNI